MGSETLILFSGSVTGNSTVNVRITAPETSLPPSLEYKNAISRWCYGTSWISDSSRLTGWLPNGGFSLAKCGPLL